MKLTVQIAVCIYVSLIYEMTKWYFLSPTQQFHQNEKITFTMFMLHTVDEVCFVIYIFSDMLINWKMWEQKLFIHLNKLKNHTLKKLFSHLSAMLESNAIKSSTHCDYKILSVIQFYWYFLLKKSLEHVDNEFLGVKENIWRIIKHIFKDNIETLDRISNTVVFQILYIYFL